MKKFHIINKKIITVFVLSMATVMMVSTFLTNVDKKELQNAVGNINFLTEEKQVQEEYVVDLLEEVKKEDNLTLKPVSYDDMSLSEKEEALYYGNIKLEYSALYTNSYDRLTPSRGAMYYNGHKETYYSQQVLPGYALNIPGRHVADDGTVRDGDGYIVVAANPSYMGRGATIITSLGPAKVYDTGCAYGVIDIYTNW